MLGATMILFLRFRPTIFLLASSSHEKEGWWCSALEEKNGDAVAAFDLIVKWMYDEERPAKFRKECAIEVMNRVWGKPTQRQESRNLDVEIQVSYTNDWRRVIRDTVDGEVHEIEE